MWRTGGDGMRRGGLYGLFFLSGASALAHELAWQRLLHLIFGVSTLATAAVLAAYMGGLALGGLLHSAVCVPATRAVDGDLHPLRAGAIDPWTAGNTGRRDTANHEPARLW